MATPTLDLRAPGQGAGFGIFAEGRNLFLGEWVLHPETRDSLGFWGAPLDVSRGYTSLGDDPLARMSVANRTTMAVSLGLNPISLPDSNLADILAHFILGTLADPTGASAVKPLRFGRNGLRLYLNGELVLNESLSRNHPNFDATLAVRLVDYRNSKAAGASLEALQRWTGHDMQTLYGHMGDDLLEALVPPEFQGDGWRNPRTTISDDFNRANADSLGANWTERAGDWDIFSNKCRKESGATAQNVAYHNTQLSTADYYVQAVVTPNHTNQHRGVVARRVDFSTSDSNFYSAILTTNGTKIMLYKRVSGGDTLLESLDFTYVVGNNYLVRIEVEGSTIMSFVDGTPYSEVTDTALSAIGFAGIHNGATNDEDWDDFEAGDLGSAKRSSFFF
jgi:hypothetical protein